MASPTSRRPSSSRRVDIVGDFAGKELFGIHGEAVIAHCIKRANVDYEEGFQLLHAVHAVEQFLDNLQQRGCHFHILWFEDSESLAVPEGSSKHDFKYRLTRIVLIEHLRNNPVRTTLLRSNISFEFPSVFSQKFHRYFAQNPLHFIVCFSAASEWGLESTARAVMKSLFAQTGASLGFIDSIEFRSSKVYIDVVTEPQRSLHPDWKQLDTPRGTRTELDWRRTMEQLDSYQRRTGIKLSTRDRIGLIACAAISSAHPDEETHAQVSAFLTHLALLKHLRLTQRSYPEAKAGGHASCENFLMKYSHTAREVIQHHIKEAAEERLGGELFDLVDGRLFRHVFTNLTSLNVSAYTRPYHDALEHIIGPNTLRLSPDDTTQVVAPLSRPSTQQDANPSELTSTVLPFSHPVIDRFLHEVRLSVESESESEATSKIFLELTHWHNTKRLIEPKRLRQPLNFWARKRNQQFMADTIAYSASLTNASGKNIEPEIIVVQSSAPKVVKQTKRNHKPEKTTKAKGKVSGKQAALDAAKAIQAKKSEDKASTVVSFWNERCQEFQAEASLIPRYLKAIKYLSGLSKAEMEAVGAELLLYVSATLALLLKSKGEISGGQKMAVLSLAWSHLQELPNWPMSKDTRKYAEKLSASLKFSLGLPDPVITARRLPFDMSVSKPGASLSFDETEFQLEYCGPYLKRSFDPTPDPRVPFTPDAWQREVLDAIDRNHSLLVIAPTSAGKTFISFYAMKKVLQNDDDDILVYVAPTKALVNQIAAEIQARFSKSYRHDGKSVWAIHTRDYRVNNPAGCQILVTVPHILQIMLLAPSNAQKENSWSRRVKRIIFDEVHCIGQANDGIIWEQLLLMAPCPIIALSATVGNPFELRDWLSGTQRAKGFKLVMFTHATRYSDLRKFIYVPSKSFDFAGFKTLKRLPCSGLDADKSDSKFMFVHPIGSILSRDKSTLEDLSLEPRDCLELWRAMDTLKSESFPLDSGVAPSRALPPSFKKSDVVKWETTLKQQLFSWMQNSASPFLPCRKALSCQIVKEKANTGKRLPMLPLIVDLRSQGGLPAIVFNFDRQECEHMHDEILQQLQAAEEEYRETSPAWTKKMKEYDEWKNKASKKQAKPAKLTKGSGMTKADLIREEANKERSVFASFDPNEPLADFSLGDLTKISRAELEDLLRPLKGVVRKSFINGLRRGMGVHHSGMNRKYRQVVELLFRRSVLTVVIATGTLALGINMPCKTVVFSGDPVFLTALNYRQASGRAGRRGFDLLGNVVFHDIPHHRVKEIMSSRLPDLRGTFPISVTLVLRLFTLLHGTDNSDYAVRVVESLFTQTRLYLGGPGARMSIAHHLRFSIEYLRRQNLLSATGEPLNFAGLVGHLYFTENAVFAFHSLLKAGYFHEICADIDNDDKRGDILLDVLLVLCHLFCRYPCRQYRDKKWLETVVRPSPSIVLLPVLPSKAADILRAHNKQTLDIFASYVHTYAQQHLHDVNDDVLPFTKRRVEPVNPLDQAHFGMQGLPAPIIRSSFAALSGHTDAFKSIHELVSSVRSGIFLDESAIPYIPIYPDETDNVPFNAYILDFFKHGDLHALVRDNGIKRGDVWFSLKDFSLILAAIVASLESTLDPHAESEDAAMVDIQDAGDSIEEGYDSDVHVEDVEGGETIANADGGSIVKVWKALKLLREEFDEKFRSVWA
ncbi:helicase [Paramyrothecium foliicola]|nr:helicase [Paramyrothecium foliicola]